MISVTIVGNGNVGFHLHKAFGNIKAQKISSRNLDSLSDTDITIIAVSDDAIEEVSSKITNSFVVHTSGNTDISQLKNSTRKGVFYPLQSFSKNVLIDYTKVPFCLEAENEKDFILLENLVNTIGGISYRINSEQRKNIHVAAIFANNFTNHMYQMAKEICDSNQIPFEILYPLMQETTNKIKNMSPLDAQTGPAIRKDKKTIKNHLNLLNSSQKDIYQILTKSIQKHGKKL